MVPNLKKFRAEQTLKQATYVYMASQMVEKQDREYIAKVFNTMDKNHDGKITVQEMQNGLAE